MSTYDAVCCALAAVVLAALALTAGWTAAHGARSPTLLLGAAAGCAGGAAYFTAGVRQAWAQRHTAPRGSTE